MQFKQQIDGWNWRTPRVSVSPDLLSITEILLIAGLALVVAKLVWTVLTPVGPVGAWLVPDRSGNASVDITILGSFDPFFREPAGNDIAQLSDLGLVLLGTRVDTVSGRGSAIIAVGDEQSSFLVGEEIVPGVRLKSVQFDDVTLDRGGAAESLFLDQSAGPAPVAPGAATGAAMAPAGPALAPPPRLSAEIAAAPRINGSEIDGYVLSPKGSGTAFAGAGLEPGDVLVSVDGVPVAGIRDPASLTQRFDAGVSIEVERAGQRLRLRVGGSR